MVQPSGIRYQYDAENQRIGVSQTSYVINFQPALSQVLVKEENGVRTFYVYGLGLMGEEREGWYRAYHFDVRGSTVALSDGRGEVVERFGYGPYGEMVSGDALTTPFLFNGMFGVMSDGNGLYYMRARFYSPVIKRFVNRDVVLGEVGVGQSLNRYAFVSGKPVSLVDPFGLAQKDVNRAIDIMKVFLPCLYNDKATVIMGNPSRWWNPRHWWIEMTGSSIDGYTVDNFITIDQKSFGGDFYLYKRVPIIDNKGTIIGYQRGELNQISVNILERLLQVLIHEYQHVNNVDSHAHIYATSELLGNMLAKYMLLENEEWEEIKRECTKTTTHCDIFRNFSAICPSVRRCHSSSTK